MNRRTPLSKGCASMNMKSLFSALAAVATIGIQAATTYTATEQYVQNLVKAESNRTDIAITLTPVYSQWICNPPALSGAMLSIVEFADLYELRSDDYPISTVVKVGGETSLTFSDRGVTANRTVIGYTLGAQIDKPLQPKGDYATTADLEGIDKLTIDTKDTSLIFSTNDVGGAVFGGMRGAGGGGSSVAVGTPEIVYKSNAIVNSTNTIVLTGNAYNNVTQGAESVLKIQIPASTGMRSRVFYLVYNCSNAEQTEIFFDINTLVTKILVADSDQMVFSPSVGTNIYKFEEIASDKFLLSRIVAIER